MARLVPMRYVHVSASGKINPALYVGPVRGDGYHDLDIFFESLDIFDEIEAKIAAKGPVRIAMQGDDVAGIPTDGTNLAVRAAELLRERCGVEDSAELIVTKRIPVAGGMAGGSADAAGALLACNELWELGLGQEQLMDIGGEIGADVPFCLLGSLARGAGKGERLRPIRPGNMHFWVLVTFGEGLSTPAVYGKLDELRAERGEDPDKALANVKTRADQLERLLGEQDTRKPARLMTNQLQEAAIALRPDLGEAIEKIGSLGLVTILSGSGPTIGILGEDYDTANAIAGHARRLVPGATIRRANGPAAGAHLRIVE